MGGEGSARSVRFVDKGEGLRIVYVPHFLDVFLPKLLHMHTNTDLKFKIWAI